MLQRLRDELTGCIGCGCLSLQRCRLANPGDVLGERGDGPMRWEWGRRGLSRLCTCDLIPPSPFSYHREVSPLWMLPPRAGRPAPRAAR